MSEPTSIDDMVTEALQAVTDSDADMQGRINALAAYTGYPASDYSPAGYSGNYGHGDIIEGDGNEWIVLTDDEADVAVVEYVTESLWAFNASFLASETGIDEAVFTALQPRCEDANDAIKTLVEQLADDGLEGFAREAVSYDGRGHFLSQWDGEEVELSTDCICQRTEHLSTHEGTCPVPAFGGTRLYAYKVA